MMIQYIAGIYPEIGEELPLREYFLEKRDSISSRVRSVVSGKKKMLKSVR